MRSCFVFGFFWLVLFFVFCEPIDQNTTGWLLQTLSKSSQIQKRTRGMTHRKRSRTAKLSYGDGSHGYGRAFGELVVLWVLILVVVSWAWSVCENSATMNVCMHIIEWFLFLCASHLWWNVFHRHSLITFLCILVVERKMRTLYSLSWGKRSLTEPLKEIKCGHTRDSWILQDQEPESAAPSSSANLGKF